jgi:hypothetical protein
MKAMIKIMVVAIITGTTVLGFTSANAWWNTSSDRWRDGPWYGGYPGYGWGGYPGYGWGGYPGYGGAETVQIITAPTKPKVDTPR